MSKYQGDFYFLYCRHSFTTEKKMNHIKNYVKIKDFWNIIIASEDTKTLDFNQYQKI